MNTLFYKNDILSNTVGIYFDSASFKYNCYIKKL